MRIEVPAEEPAIAPAIQPYGELADDPGMGLRLAQLVVFKDLARTFAPVDLSPAEFAALSLVNQQPGLRIARLGELLAIQTSNLVSFLGKLMQRDLIRRERDAFDKRSFQLWLTDEGAALLARARQAHEAHRQRITDHLGPGKREELARLLMQLATFRPI